MCGAADERRLTGDYEHIKEFYKNEISNWKRWEMAWLFTTCAVIAAFSIYWKDSLMGISSSLTGVACVVCMGKGSG